MGPTVAVLLDREAHAAMSAELLEIARTVDESARTSIEVSVRDTRSIGGAVDVQEHRPFGFNVGDVGVEPGELNVIRRLMAFSPLSAIHVFAYGNDPVDHRILAEFALFFARRYRGIIDFGGNLGRIEADLGTLVEIRYSVNGTPAAFHVSDTVFLEAWLNNAAFHMIK